MLSDTHSFLDKQLFDFFSGCDEIWHAGDFGSLEVSDKLSKFKPLRGVYGNIDGQEIRKIHNEYSCFDCEEVKVLILHIGGYPGRYSLKAQELIRQVKPGLFISGHSHILKVIKDPNQENLLHINPGAAGKEGFHQIRTAVRFEIDKGIKSKLEVIELGKR